MQRAPADPEVVERSPATAHEGRMHRAWRSKLLGRWIDVAQGQRVLPALWPKRRRVRSEIPGFWSGHGDVQGRGRRDGELAKHVACNHLSGIIDTLC